MAFVILRFNFFSVAFFATGLLSLAAGLFSFLQNIYRSNHSLQKNNSLFLVLKISLSILLFIIVNVLAHRFDGRWDVTKIKQHTLSTQTKNIISKTNKKIKITVFYVGLPPTYLEDLLNEYRKNSQGFIETEMIDPLAQIGYAAQFGNVISGQERKAIVQSGAERKDIDFTDHVLTEAELTQAIVKASRRARNIYFLGGHQEFDIDDTLPIGFSKFKILLESRNCRVQKIRIDTNKNIPSDCDVLVVAGVKNPLSQNEKEIVQNYLEKGGKALFLIESTLVESPDHPLSQADKLKNPSLNDILNRWGVQIGDDIVVDLENYAGQDVGCPVTKNYPRHKEIVSHLDYTFYIRPRSITFKDPIPADVKVAPLVLTSSKEKSWAETNKALQVKFDAATDLKGPVMIAAILWGPKNDKRSDDTKIIVFSDADFASNQFIEQYSNATIAVNSINWLSDIEPELNIHSPTPETTTLDLSSKQIRLIVVILIAIPLFILSVGYFSWLKFR